MTKDELNSFIDEIGVVGPAWEKLKEVLRAIVGELEDKKKGKK